MQLDLQRALSAGGRVDVSMEAGPLDWEGGGAVQAAPARMQGKLARVKQGFDFEGRLDGGLTLECVRCLEEFSHPLAFDFHLVFVNAQETPRSGETQIQEGDCDYYPCSEGKVDLAAVAREQMYLHIPLKPVCQEQCRGLCLVCGESLKHDACRCGAQAHVRVI